MKRASVKDMTGGSSAMQGPIRSNSAQPLWRKEEARQLAPAQALGSHATGSARPGGGMAGASSPFGSILRATSATSQAPGATHLYEIQRGDTLSAIAQRRLQELGLPSGGPEIVKAVERLAVANSLGDANRIYAGAHLDLGVLGPNATGSAPIRKTQEISSQALPTPAVTSPRPTAVALRQSQFPQLQKTLDRAVERGYVEARDRQAVEDRIVAMSRKYQFSPDDLATVALMESDGFNPRATNGRCHGILQFCEGSNSGAASVGMKGRASEILDKPVLAQLDLAERYFQDNRLGEKGPVSLVDLYLTVLTPAARSEQRPHAALDIAGRQATALHVSGDRSQPITRQSILSGLLSHAHQRLDALIHPRRSADLPESRQVRVEMPRMPVDRLFRPAGATSSAADTGLIQSQGGRQG
jgi:hypothetical protein